MKRIIEVNHKQAQALMRAWTCGAFPFDFTYRPAEGRVVVECDEPDKLPLIVMEQYSEDL